MQINRTLVVVLFFCITWLGVCVPAQAITITNLYTASIPVKNETQAVRKQAFQAALQETLVKVSGNSAVASSDKAIKQALRQAETYVEQYSYKQKQQNRSTQLLLKVDFSPTAVETLLKKHGQPVWGRNRPLMLVWLALKHSGGSHIVNDETQNHQLVEQIKQTANSRGLPVIWPLMDLKDVQAITAQDIEQDNVLALENASQRYLPDAILAISINTREKPIVSQWHLIFQGKQEDWQESDKKMSLVIQKGINDVVDAIAGDYAIQSTSQTNQIQLQVSNLQSAAEYAQLSSYLKGLPGVSAVQIQSVSGQKVVFQLALKGKLHALIEQIKLGHHLVPVSQYGNRTDQAQGLSYRYQNK